MSDLHDALYQVKARAEKATEGPWWWEKMRSPRGGYAGFEVLSGSDHEFFSVANGDEGANGDFIAAARTDVSRLVAALEAVHNVVENYPLPHKRDDPTAEIASAIEGLGDAVFEALADKLTGEDDE